ncbi:MULTISPECIES: hypothetical protein [unclassified Aeromonas]|uniref:hypothetical protein n=1 Tax=unclassified Aeromonas TaxID=257493 RepID=UPI0022DF6E05|nr:MULTISPECIES: hypothetical protein [unclassified Aeromonas]
MSRLSIAIEDLLHSAGYKTERMGGEVNVYIPVFRTICNEPILDCWDVKEIRSVKEAFDFIGRQP